MAGGGTGPSVAVAVWILFQMVAVMPAGGQQQLVSTCQQCLRHPQACRRIAGLYTVTVLTKGTYNPVVEIPPQACSINVTELAPSQNYLAIKTDRGDSIVNGKWSVGSTGSFNGVGTRFEYKRGGVNCPGECITSDGPTDRRVIVQLLYYNKNPGIAYSFVLPNDVPFQPFDKTAPQVESRSRSSPSHGASRRHGHNRQRSSAAASASAVVVPAPSAPEPYISRPRQSSGLSQVQEPRGPIIRSQRTGASSSSNRKAGESSSASDYNYRGSSYGSHTLGGRGQSYTFQYTDGNNNNNNPASVGRQPSSSISSSSSSSRSQFPQRRGSIIRSRAGYEGSRSQGSSFSSRRQRPSYSRRPSPHRQQGPSWRAPHTPRYISAYDPDASRGYQTLASSSRGGLVDRTYSRGQDVENRLQTFERPVDQRPALSIGTGGSGNEYEWTISGLTDCSRTCGGGTQETQVVCVLTSSGTQVVVTSDNCENSLKPRLQRVSCNNEPCPPAWETEEWSECSVTCGGGTQSRRIECRQRFSDSLELSVSASQCDQSQKPAVAQQCNNDPCSQWREGQWTECSAECGGGERQRAVECVDGQGVQIPASFCSGDKPAEKERCNTHTCNNRWWHSRWSDQCSASCGAGITSRHVVCADRAGQPVAKAACDNDQQPHDRKRCESSVGCGSLWFTGPWSQCSDSCGQGVKTRQVLCMQKKTRQAALTAVDEAQCSADSKPASEEPCFNSACGAQYYMTGWSQCSVTCGNGYKTREVKCLDENQQPSWLCDRSHAPSQRESCQLSACRKREEVRDRAPQTSRSDGACKDTFWNCRLVVQARLCPYYKQACCAACRLV